MKFASNLSNRTAYTLILLGAILLIGIGVYAYNSGGPASFVGHTWDEIICDDNMCVNTTSGEVGIGTMSPGAKLQIGNSLGDWSKYNEIVIGGNTAPGIRIGESETTAGYILWNPSKDLLTMGTKVSAVNYPNTLVLKNGDIGIGMMEPGQKLDVNGDIHASGDICTDQGGGKCLSTTGSSSTSISCNFPGEVKSTITNNVEYTTCNSVCETGYYCPGDLWKQKRTEFVNVTCSSEGYISSMNSVWSPWSSCYCVDGCTENPGGL